VHRGAEAGSGTSLTENPWPQRCEVAILLALAVPLVVAAAALAWRSTLQVEINYNEGWNAYLASAAVTGGPMYFAPSDLQTDNYPPLSFYIVGAVMRLVPDAVFAGRLVAWAAFVAIGTSVAAILRSLGDDRVSVAFGAMLFVGYMISQYHSYVGMDDPQMLAHAVMAAGLLILVRGQGGVRSAVAAAFVMSAGLFIKHSIVAMPLAVAAWLLIYDRRAGFAFMATGAVCIAAGLVLCRAAFGSNFLAGLQAARQYSIVDGYRKVVPWLMPMQAPLSLAALSIMRPMRDRHAVLFALYVGTALIVGAVTATGNGITFNSMFETVIALSLACGHLMGRLGRRQMSAPRGLRPLAIAVAVLCLLLSFGFRAGGDVVRVLAWARAMRAEETETREAVAIIAARPGAALCETLVLCYWAGKPFALDAFNFGEAVRVGTRDDSALVDRISAGAYTSAQVEDASADHPPRLPPRALAALREHFVTVPIAPVLGTLFVAR
jgi:hypothetical protein